MNRVVLNYSSIKALLKTNDTLCLSPGSYLPFKILRLRFAQVAAYAYASIYFPCNIIIDEVYITHSIHSPTQKHQCLHLNNNTTYSLLHVGYEVRTLMCTSCTHNYCQPILQGGIATCTFTQNIAECTLISL